MDSAQDFAESGYRGATPVRADPPVYIGGILQARSDRFSWGETGADCGETVAVSAGGKRAAPRDFLREAAALLYRS